ncbi:MAG: 16S rRNA (cytidine(1402)-2'-O)-methyltransferase [Smithellaceae bacterium]
MDERASIKKGILYVVATPIGNLEDISLRAIRTLKEVDLIAAEDTRHTKKLLNAYKISTPLISLHKHNEKGKSELIISKINSGMNVAYVSDAGTPSVSDPGHYLIGFAQDENIRVIPIPGPSAVITALSVSGFSADRFLFCGFMPTRENQRRKFMESMKDEERTIVFYESPMRFFASLKTLQEMLGDREIVVARELTKIFEEIKRGKISEFIASKTKIKGEITIIIRSGEKAPVTLTDEEIIDKLKSFSKNKQLSLRDAVTEVVNQTGISKKNVYNLALRLRWGKATKKVR